MATKGIFDGCVFSLHLPNEPLKRKTEIANIIRQNGGSVIFGVNKTVSHFVTSFEEITSTTNFKVVDVYTRFPLCYVVLPSFVLDSVQFFTRANEWHHTVIDGKLASQYAEGEEEFILKRFSKGLTSAYSLLQSTADVEASTMKGISNIQSLCVETIYQYDLKDMSSNKKDRFKPDSQKIQQWARTPLSVIIEKFYGSIQLVKSQPVQDDADVNDSNQLSSSPTMHKHSTKTKLTTHKYTSTLGKSEFSSSLLKKKLAWSSKPSTDDQNNTDNNNTITSYYNSSSQKSERQKQKEEKMLAYKEAIEQKRQARLQKLEEQRQAAQQKEEIRVAKAEEILKKRAEEIQRLEEAKQKIQQDLEEKMRQLEEKTANYQFQFTLLDKMEQDAENNVDLDQYEEGGEFAARKRRQNAAEQEKLKEERMLRKKEKKKEKKKQRREELKQEKRELIEERRRRKQEYREQKEEQNKRREIARIEYQERHERKKQREAERALIVTEKKQNPPKPTHDLTKLFVGGITFEDLEKHMLSDEKLELVKKERAKQFLRMFEEFGSIVSKKDFILAKHHCFVAYRSVEQAERAFETLTKYDERKRISKSITEKLRERFGEEAELYTPSPHYYVRHVNSLSKPKK